MNPFLPDYLARWNLSNPQPLARTFTSDLYTVMADGEKAVLKILSAVGQADEAGGAAALQWYDGDGAVRLLRHDDGAMLLEYAAGGDLAELVRQGKDDDATAIAAATLGKLHAPRSTFYPANLTTLAERFRSLLGRSPAIRQDDRLRILAHGAEVARQLLATPEPPVVLHGDLHHENIRHHPTRGWLAIDPKGLVGERTYDAANLLCNPHTLPDVVRNRERLMRQAGILAAALKFDPARFMMFAFAYVCLSVCWSIEDGQDYALALNVAEIAESLLGQ